MSTASHQRLKFIKRTAKRFLWLALIALILLFLFWWMIRKDNPYVLNKIRSHAVENWNANLSLGGYELKFRNTFPNLTLHLKHLQFGISDTTRLPIFTTNMASIDFDPWDLYRNKAKENAIRIDSLWVMIHQDSLDQSNLTFKDKGKNMEGDPASFQLANLVNIKANYIDFKHQNDYRNVWQAFQLTTAQILPAYNEREELTFQLKSHAHFDGLVFKPSDGAFLSNTSGELQINLGWNKKQGMIRMDDSFLKTTQDDFQISGQITQGDVGKIHLDIIDDDILLSELLPKLSNKARAALGNIKVDQPIKGHFSLDNLIIPNRNGAVNIDFETNNASIQYGEANISSAHLKGSYSNDCDGNGLGDPLTSCILIDQLDGDIFGQIPTELQGSISNLREPAVDMIGKMNLDLPRLNTLLSTKDKLTFNDGTALINFNYTGDLKKIITDPFSDEHTDMKGDVDFKNIVISSGDRGLMLPALTGHMTFNEKQSRLQDLSLNWMGSNILIKGQIGNLPEFLFYRKEALQSNLDLYFDELDLNKFSSSAHQPQNKITPKFVNQSIRKLAYNINGKIDLKIDKLIFDTLFVTELNTHFELFTPEKNKSIDSTLIRMDELTGKLFGESPFLLDLSILQEESNILVMDLSMPSMTKVANRLLPSSTRITNGHAGLKLTARAPIAALFNTKSLFNELSYQGILTLDSIHVHASKSEFPVKLLSGPVEFNSRNLFFDRLTFEHKGSPFSLDGTIKNYSLLNTNQNNKGIANLSLSGNYFDARYDRTKFKESNLKNNFSPPEIFRSLDTIFHYAFGKINIHLDSILTNGHTIEPFDMQAKLLPNPKKTIEHLLMIDSVRMGFGADSYVRGNLLIENVDQPEVMAKLDANMELNRLGELLPSEYIDLVDGNFQMDLEYQSPLHDSLNAKNYLLKADITGHSSISDGNIYYNYRDFTIDQINGHFSFDQNTLKIPSLSMNINDNDLTASGESIDFFPFFILPNQKTSIDLSIASSKFDFGKFSSPQKIKTHAMGGKSLEVIVKKNPTSNAIEQTFGYIDLLLAKGTIKMDTEIGEVKYQKFAAKNFEGIVVAKPDTVLLSNVNMIVAQGSFGIDGLISGIVDHEPTVAVQVNLKDNDLQEILTQFENFDQVNFTNENIKGKITASMNFKSDIDEDYNFKSESMEGEMTIKLTGGEVKNIEALSNKDNFLTKGRKLEHILLDTLEFSTLLKGDQFYVKNSRIISSAADFNLEGVYHLADKQESRILFTVPLRNLFKRYSTRAEIEKHQYKGKGIPILIESSYKKGKLKNKWKLFVNREKRGYLH